MFPSRCFKKFLSKQHRLRLLAVPMRKTSKPSVALGAASLRLMKLSVIDDPSSSDLRDVKKFVLSPHIMNNSNKLVHWISSMGLEQEKEIIFFTSRSEGVQLPQTLEKTGLLTNRMLSGKTSTPLLESSEHPVDDELTTSSANDDSTDLMAVTSALRDSALSAKHMSCEKLANEVNSNSNIAGAHESFDPFNDKQQEELERLSPDRLSHAQEEAFRCSMEGDLEQLNHMLNETKVLSIDDLRVFHPNTGASLLHYACENGHVDVLRWLLHLRILDVEVPSRHNGSTPLMWAINMSQVEVVRVLLFEFGADPNCKVNTCKSSVRQAGHEQTGAHWAAENADVEILELLKEFDRMSLFHVDAREATPLSVSKSKQQKQCQTVLEETYSEEMIAFRLEFVEGSALHGLITLEQEQG